MIKCLFVIFALAVTVTWASPLLSPHDQRSFIDTQQFLVLHPQVVTPHLSPLKYEQPIIAPITQLGHISTPKEQLYFFYPSSPLSEAPVVSFQRDDGGDFNLISFISNWFASKPAESAVPAPAPVADAPPAPAAAQPAIELQPAAQEPAKPVDAPQPAAEQQPQQSNNVGEELRPVILSENLSRFPSEQKKDKIEINPDAELIPQTPTQQQPAAQPYPLPLPPQPAYAPFPLTPQLPDRRVYIVSGQPQFFGNFDAFANPLNPIFSLQPLTPIIGRNKEDSKIEAVENENAAAVPEADSNAETVEAPAAAADLRTSPEVVAEEPVVKNSAEEILADPNPSVDVFARSNSRVDFFDTENGGVQVKELTDVEKRIADTIQDAPGGKSGYVEPSVAQAAPSGLAIAGVGGVASSQPMATAVSGDGGISLASPKATSIAGDFFDFDGKKKIKLTKDDN